MLMVETCQLCGDGVEYLRPEKLMEADGKGFDGQSGASTALLDGDALFFLFL